MCAFFWDDPYRSAGPPGANNSQQCECAQTGGFDLIATENGTEKCLCASWSKCLPGLAGRLLLTHPRAPPEQRHLSSAEACCAPGARWGRASSLRATTRPVCPARVANSPTAWATLNAPRARASSTTRTARRGPRRRPRQSSASARRAGCSCSSTRIPPPVGAPQEKKWWSKMIRPVVGNAARGLVRQGRRSNSPN